MDRAPGESAPPAGGAGASQPTLTDNEWGPQRSSSGEHTGGTGGQSAARLYFQPEAGEAGPGRDQEGWHSIAEQSSSDDGDSDVDEQQYQDDAEAAPFLAHPPLRTRWNPYPTLLFLLYLGAAGFYFYVRIAHTLVPMGDLMGYGIFILCVEFLGLTAMLPYSVLLVRSTLPNKTKGLPPASAAGTPAAQRVPKFTIHVLIPCYKEPIEVVSKTIEAAFVADIPVNATRKVYLCDDAVADNDEGKQLQAERRTFIERLDPQGMDVRHITGRLKKKGEGNGKSNNVNNCLQNHIFSKYREVHTDQDGEEVVEWDYRSIPLSDVVVVFDSDMVCEKRFFLRILEVMADDGVALCLTPQAFTNTNPRADVFNNVNFQFWEYWLPGSDAQGYIACTGTNFCIRARPLAHAGWFPTYTITEDYALGMELKRRGYVGKYLLEYMVFGEAPDNIRNVFRQRSRWCKGHMQVFFSARSPLWLAGLPFTQRLWYSYGTWCYFVSIVTIPVFMVAPILALIAGINPVFINRWFAAGATVYYFTGFLIQNYVRKLSHLKGLWFANISNTVLWFTYTKAVISVISSKMGLKVIGFKATVKKGDPSAPPPPPTIGERLRMATRRMTMRMGSIMRNPSQRGRTPVSVPASPAETPTHPDVLSPAPSLGFGGRPPGSRMARPPVPPPSPDYQRLLEDVPHLTAPVPKTKKKGKAKVLMGKSWRTVKGATQEFRSNYGTMEGTWDLVALTVILLLCLATFCAGVYRLVHNSNVGAIVSYADAGVPMMWALYNAVPAYLFIHYCFDKGRSLETASSICQNLQALLGAAAVAFLWVLLPIRIDHGAALNMTMKFFEAQQSGPVDALAAADVPWMKASGENMQPVGGWYANGDHIKYSVPVANAAALLAWGYLQFGQAYGASGAKARLMHNLEHVGKYLLSCYSEGPEGQHFVYRMGNPHRYAVFKTPNNIVDPEGLSPEKLRMIWTSPDNDPELQNPENVKFKRVLFKAAGGGPSPDDILAADVIGSATAALAAIARVMSQEGKADMGQQMLDVAKKVFSMQTASRGAEQSACSILDTNVGALPCELSQQVKVRVPDLDLNTLGPIKCWVADWVQTTCVPSYSEHTCEFGKVKGKNFFQPADCCAYMQGTNVWNGTTPKGICILPAYNPNRPCFFENLVINSCERSMLDMVTGTGCGGPGMSVYSSASLCCNAMATKGSFTVNSPAHGLCAPNLTTCFIPSLSQKTCLSRSGAECTMTGLQNYFENELGCCDYLTRTMSERMMGAARGVCESTFKDPPPPLSPPAPLAPGPPPPPLVDPALGTPPLPGGRRRLAQAQPKATPPPPAAARIAPPPPRAAAGQPPPPAAATPDPSETPPEAPPAPQAPLPVLGGDPSITAPGMKMKEMPVLSTATFYKSNYVLDDMAWGGAWLHWATGDPSFLGHAEYYLQMHAAKELRPDSLTSDPRYYVANWDNLAWATKVLLADITKAPKYISEVKDFFNTWIGHAPVSPVREMYARQAATNSSMQNPYPKGMPDGSICTPTAGIETDCSDGKDDDCNGLVDEDDLACPFKPVKYMDGVLAWTKDAPLPNAASTAFLALSLARNDHLSTTARKKLRCWALGQVDYILGAGQGGQSSRSYLVGYGKDYPLRPQHRAASCNASFTCDWGNFYSGAANPHVLQGALVAGPPYKGEYPDDRADPSSRVGVDYTAPLSGALAGVMDTKINIQECSQWNGLIENVFGRDDII